MTLQLKKFNMASIKDNQIIVLIGKRNTGKSVLTKDFLYHKRDIPVGTVVSPTEGANKYYGDFVPPLFIHDEFSPKLLHNVVKRQKDIISKINKGTYGADVDPRAFLIFDDCLYNNDWAKDKNMRYIFMNGRHVKITFILTMQFPLGIPPNLRTNIDYVFILRENTTSNRRRIYEHYAGMFPTFDAFNIVMDNCTENFECLVIHNAAKSNRLDEQVFWYKAEQHPDFRIGSPLLWQYSSDHFDKDGDEDDEIDINNIGKKNRYTFNVKKLI